MKSVTSMLSKMGKKIQCAMLEALRFSSSKSLTLPILVTVLLGSALLVACSGDASNTADGGLESDSKPLVITTVFASYDFAREVAGTGAEVKMLVPPGSETHSFEPTPQDMIDLENCELFIYVGGESDAWVDELLAAVDNPNMQTIRMLDLVETVLEDESILVEGVRQQEDDHEHEEDSAWGGTTVEHDDHDEHADDEHEEAEHSDHGADEANGIHTAETDEHVWTSPRNAIVICEEIAVRLGQISPQNLTLYEQNTTAYCEKLTALDKEFQRIVDTGSRKTLVFGDRFAFRYFADDYGLECKAAFPGCSTATQPSAKTVAALVDYALAEHVPVVFYRELSDHRLADSICLETGAIALELNSCHNVSKEDFNGGVSYLSIMYDNAAALKIALG